MSVIIHPTDHAKIEDFVRKGIEFGGSFYLDLEVLKLNDITTGTSNSVDVPSAAVQFHTHSGHCPNNVCLIGVPSPPDIGEFNEAVWAGETSVHCVYAREGTYCMRITEPRPVGDDSAWKPGMIRDLTLFRDSITGVSFPAHKKPKHYRRFQDRWRGRARRWGVDIVFYPLGVIPRFSRMEADGSGVVYSKIASAP